MKCPNCGNPTHGGYCDCMIKDGEFVGLPNGSIIKFIKSKNVTRGSNKDKIFGIDWGRSNDKAIQITINKDNDGKYTLTKINELDKL